MTRIQPRSPGGNHSEQVRNKACCRGASFCAGRVTVDGARARSLVAFSQGAPREHSKIISVPPGTHAEDLGPRARGMSNID
jgi:hypothetical protein